MKYRLKIKGRRHYEETVYSDYGIACLAAIAIVEKNKWFTVSVYSKRGVRYRRDMIVNKKNYKRQKIRIGAITVGGDKPELNFFEKMFSKEEA